MGLKYDPKFVEKLMGKNVLELSSTYQALMKEGLEKGIELGLERGLEQGLEQGLKRGQQEQARATLLRQGRRRLGEPSEQALTTLQLLTDQQQLEGLLDRVWEVESWSELLSA